MRTRHRIWISTAALLVAAAAAIGGAWLGVARKDEAAEARKDADARLYAFAPAKVKAVTVEAKGEVTRLARSGDGWRVETPVVAEADRYAVDALVERVSELRRKAQAAGAPGQDELARYGLTRPRAKVSLALQDGKTETLAMGDENPFDGTAFVRTTGGAVEIVPGDLKWVVERGTFDLREKQVLPFEEKDLQRVEVVTPGPAYTLVRDGGAWRLEAPVKDRADDAAVSRVLGAIRGLRATAFERPAAGAIQRPRWKVTLVAAAGSARTLLVAPVGKPDAGSSGPLRAQVEGASEVAILPEGATKELEQDPAALRSKPPPAASPDGGSPGGQATSGGGAAVTAAGKK